MHSFSINTPPLKHGQTYPPDSDIDLILVIEGIQGSNLSHRNERGRGRRISRNWARGASIFGGLRPTHRIYSRSVEFFVTATPRSIFAQPGVETTSRSTFRGHMRTRGCIRACTVAYALRYAPSLRSIQRFSKEKNRDFPIDRTERFVQHERKREKKLSIIEKKKDSFLIRDRFENERLRIIEGSVRKRGQWDNERRASGRYTVSLYFPWWNNAHMEEEEGEEGGWNISGQRVLCALGGKFSLAEAITKWIKHWSNVICIMGSSIRRNEIIIINYYYIYLPINR